MADETTDFSGFAYSGGDETPDIQPEVTPEVKPDVAPEIKPETPEVKPDVKPDIKPEVKPDIKPEDKPAAVTTVDWKAAIKTADKYEALKELGYDDFTIGMLKYKEVAGDYTPYLEVKTVDYSKMTPEQLVRMDIKKKNPGMLEKALEFQTKKELNEKYYLNREDYPQDSDEAIYGQERLRLDGENIRKAYTDEQSKFKAPEPQPDVEASKKEAEQQRVKASLGEAVMNNAATKTLLSDKALVYGEGKESFRFPIADVQPLIDSALNAIVNSGRNDLSGVDMNTFFKSLAYGANPAKFEKELIDHGRSLAKGELQAELQNRSPQDQNTPIDDKKIDYSEYGYRR